MQTIAGGHGHGRISVWLPDEIAADLEEAIASIRSRVEPFVPVWVAVTVLFAQAREEWERSDPERRIQNVRILKHDGWRWRVPGCKSRHNLEIHPIVFRSQGGDDAPSNKITLCATHHRRLVHEGRMRVTGKAPHALKWVLGIPPGHEPLLRLKGEKLVR